MSKIRIAMTILIVIAIASPIVWQIAYRTDDDAAELKWGLKLAEQYAEAELAIERLRKAEDTDWSQIGEKYILTKPVVRKIDDEFETDYARELEAAIALCVVGQSPKVNQQTLAKGLQHVTVLAIQLDLDLLTASDDAAQRKDAAERITAFFEGIRPTFARRDGDFFKDAPKLESSADAAIAELKKTAETGDGLAARRKLESAIAHTYALSVLYEIQAIEKLRDSDRAACDVKLAEAEMFYRIIRPRIKDPAAGETIVALLKLDYGKMDSTVLHEALAKGLPNIPLR